MKRCQAAIVAALLMMGCLQPVVARGENLPYSLSITPFAGGYVFEGNQQLKNSEVYGLAVGYNVTQNWALELTGTYSPDLTSTAVPPQQKVNLYEVRGDILYHFIPQNRFVPYVAAGGGIIFFDSRQGQVDHDTLVDYGAGIKIFLTDYLALRGDVRHILDFNVRDVNRRREVYNNIAYTAGLTFQLGGVKQAVAPSAPVEEKGAAPRAAEWTYTEPSKLDAAKQMPSAETEQAAPVSGTAPAGADGAPVTFTAGTTGYIPAGQITVTGISIDQDAIDIIATGRITRYRTFTLSQPARLVIDISDGINGLGAVRVPVHKFGILAVRFGNHPNFLRIVLDSAQGKLLPYRITETDNGLKINMTGP
ncbi:MAG: hypothetical protein CXR31_06840 [Geobacter sp.]|nr:MAG: hypothetical protein CXR31_06840 [Geobacter sp.]